MSFSGYYIAQYTLISFSNLLVCCVVCLYIVERQESVCIWQRNGEREESDYEFNRYRNRFGYGQYFSIC